MLHGVNSRISECSGDREVQDHEERVQTVVGQQDHGYVLVTEIGPGQAFGEEAFFTGKESRTTVVASSCCQAQTVTVGPFCRVLHEWPDIRHDVMVHATRVSRMPETHLEQHAKDNQQDQLQGATAWTTGAYGEEFDPRDQEFRIG